nr:MAG TPA: hypothetical protein [Caudoviricetes sp.]
MVLFVFMVLASCFGSMWLCSFISELVYIISFISE